MTDTELHKYAEGYFLGTLMIRDTLHEIPREDIPRLKEVMRQGALATVQKLCEVIDVVASEPAPVAGHVHNQKAPF